MAKIPSARLAMAMSLSSAWRPLVERRALPGIEPVQFALAGMNAHTNHDLPVAMVTACTALASRLLLVAV
jgi:hypothetical protein